MDSDTDAELDKILQKACSEAIFNAAPAGVYPLDVAIIAEARTALRRLIAKEVTAGRIDELQSYRFFRTENARGSSDLNQALHEYERDRYNKLKQEGATNNEIS